MACILLAFLGAILLATLVHVAVGVLGLIGIALGGLFFILSQQKKGLHSKTRSAGTYIVSPRFRKGAGR